MISLFKIFLILIQSHFLLQSEIKYNECSKFPSHNEINFDLKDISWYKYLEEIYYNKNLRNINKESFLINKKNIELIYRNTKVHTRIYTTDNKSINHYSKYNPPTNFAKYNTIFIPRVKELIPFHDHSWVEVIRYKVGSLWSTSASEGYTSLSNKVLSTNQNEKVPYGCWFFPRKGSGMFINIGKSLVIKGNNHNDVINELESNVTKIFNSKTGCMNGDNAPKCYDKYLCTLALKYGYDSIQPYYGLPEIVICSGKCKTTEVFGACPPVNIQTNLYLSNTFNSINNNNINSNNISSSSNNNNNNIISNIDKSSNTCNKCDDSLHVMNCENIRNIITKSKTSINNKELKPTVCINLANNNTISTTTTKHVIITCTVSIVLSSKNYFNLSSSNFDYSNKIILDLLKMNMNDPFDLTTSIMNSNIIYFHNIFIKDNIEYLYIDTKEKNQLEYAITYVDNNINSPLNYQSILNHNLVKIEQKLISSVIISYRYCFKIGVIIFNTKYFKDTLHLESIGNRINDESLCLRSLDVHIVIVLYLLDLNISNNLQKFDYLLYHIKEYIDVMIRFTSYTISSQNYNKYYCNNQWFNNNNNNTINIPHKLGGDSNIIVFNINNNKLTTGNKLLN